MPLKLSSSFKRSSNNIGRSILNNLGDNWYFRIVLQTYIGILHLVHLFVDSIVKKGARDFVVNNEKNSDDQILIDVLINDIDHVFINLCNANTEKEGIAVKTTITDTHSVLKTYTF